MKPSELKAGEIYAIWLKSLQRKYFAKYLKKRRWDEYWFLWFDTTPPSEAWTYFDIVGNKILRKATKKEINDIMIDVL